jgi:hypothetical protein
MSKPSIYSKTRSKLRRDLAVARTRPLPEKHAFPESIDTGTPYAKRINDDNEEETG